ncbi:MAG: prepilin-type N-terminal cleavage/methylation domain-containing protein [Candidatus Omnitrophica bacterium]|nr:prepilin-type N-terminal cleavage/methylation domain-containing protein [Candidatus Omnitrophota bacterium]
MRQRIWRINNTDKGFTLLELLITASLIALMGLAIYSTFARGIAVWERGGMTDVIEQETRFGLEKMAKELRNSFKFSGIKFSGTKNDVSFPTYVNIAGIGEAPKWEVGEVSYFYSSKKKSFFRKKANYVDLFQDDEPEAEEMVSQINNLEISYYFFDPIGKSYKWKDSWDGKESFPLGVKISLTVGSGEDEKEFIKTVYLPR